MSTFKQQLDLVIARTGVERYRYLCLEHPDPRVRQQYRDWVARECARDPDAPALIITNTDCGECEKKGTQVVRRK
jgi:hypothetical protein